MNKDTLSFISVTIRQIKHYGIVFLLILSFTTAASAQIPEEVPNPHKYAIAWDLSTLFFGGLQFDLDMKIKERQWLQIAPIAYLYPGLTSYTSYDYYDYYDYYYYDPSQYDVYDLKGFGIDLNYKYFLNKKEYFYCIGGLSYSYLKTSMEYSDFVCYYEDGLPYYQYVLIDEKQNFNRIGAMACIGLQTPMRHQFFIDAYLGIGYRYAFYDNSKCALNDKLYDYGYRGLYPAFGVRMGWAF